MFWFLAACITIAVIVALFYAAYRGEVNATGDLEQQALVAHHKARLAEIETDLRAGRLSDEGADAARAELAREVIRDQQGSAGAGDVGRGMPKTAVAGMVLLVGAVSFGTYITIGSPQLPTQPLAMREMPQAPQISLEEAVVEVERRLTEDPEDVRGWRVLGPVYMQMGRFDDAVHAFRRVLALAPPTADAETNLAEAVMMANGGDAEGEPMQLLQSAAARDPEHIRSRFYLAGEAMRRGDYEDAAALWRGLLGLAQGTEPWVETARRGLAVAEAGGVEENGSGVPGTDLDQSQAIRGMVEGLSERLYREGGSIDEWTRLVRSRLVLGETDLAQAAYDAARAAYPDPAARSQLDQMATNAGLN